MKTLSLQESAHVLSKYPLLRVSDIPDGGLLLDGQLGVAAILLYMAMKKD